MPIIVAKQDGPCTACMQQIVTGERMDFDRQRGARHLTCVDSAPQLRVNQYATRCEVCGKRLGKGAGRLEVVEQRAADGQVRRTWTATCIEVIECGERCARALVASFPPWRRSGRRGG